MSEQYDKMKMPEGGGLPEVIGFYSEAAQENWLRNLLAVNPNVKLATEDNVKQFRAGLDRLVQKYNVTPEDAKMLIVWDSIGTVDQAEVADIQKKAQEELQKDGYFNLCSEIPLPGEPQPCVLEPFDDEPVSKDNQPEDVHEEEPSEPEYAPIYIAAGRIYESEDEIDQQQYSLKVNTPLSAVNTIAKLGAALLDIAPLDGYIVATEVEDKHATFVLDLTDDEYVHEAFFNKLLNFNDTDETLTLLQVSPTRVEVTVPLPLIKLQKALRLQTYAELLVTAERAVKERNRAIGSMQASMKLRDNMRQQLADVNERIAEYEDELRRKQQMLFTKS